jgi:lysozyme family protein
MANRGFLDAVEVVLKNEGGFVNHPADRGGPTNWGITQKVYEAYKGRPVSIDEIKNMPRSEAIAIYKRNYWDKIGGDQLKYYATALTLFDQAVNRGVAAVIRQVQGILGLNQDGRLGSQTIAALNAIPDTKFIPQFLTAAENSYKAIVQKNPSQSVFINGWLKRVDHLKKQATQFFGQLNNVQKVGLGIGFLALLGVGGYLAYQSFKNKGK